MYYILAMDYEGDYEIIDYAFDKESALDINDNRMGDKVLKDIYLKGFLKTNTVTNLDEWKNFIK